jgi:hypothetical protein
MKPFEKKTIDALRFMVGIFNKYDIPYRIGGGFSAKMYGSPRPLNDIDFGIQEKNFSIILPEISQYITYGPIRSNDDGKWDCELITLNYNGQEIDISGTDTMRISNKERTKWISRASFPYDTVDMNVEGINIKVLNGVELMTYKKELDGEHQLIDIKAIEEYLATIQS